MCVQLLWLMRDLRVNDHIMLTIPCLKCRFGQRMVAHAQEPQNSKSINETPKRKSATKPKAAIYNKKFLVWRSLFLASDCKFATPQPLVGGDLVLLIYQCEIVFMKYGHFFETCTNKFVHLNE